MHLIAIVLIIPCVAISAWAVVGMFVMNKTRKDLMK